MNAVDLPAVCLVTGATDCVRFERRSVFRRTPWAWLVVPVTLLIPQLGCPMALVWIAVVTFGHRRESVAVPLTSTGSTLARLADVVGIVTWLSLFPAMALATMGLWSHSDVVGTPVFAVVVLVAHVLQRFTLGRSRITFRKSSPVDIELEIPNRAAATKVEARLHGWTTLLDAPWSTRRAPEPRDCPGHAGTSAHWICGRCGSFACDACLSRVRPDAMLLCRTCLARRWV